MPTSPALPTTVVAFDFDGTLSRRDCVVPFMRRVSGTWRLVSGLLAPWHRLVPSLLHRDRDALKAAAADVAFTGRSATDVDELGKAFARHVEVAWLRDDTRAALERHLADGHRVLVVSASLEPYLAPLGEALGVDATLCTRLEVDGDGMLTGRLLGANCRAEEKVRRVTSWLHDQGLRRQNVHLVAYGDSAGDHALLREADASWWAAHRTLAVWRSP